MLYPSPTVWSSHVYIALNEEGTAGIDGLQDEEIQQIAWEKHGFRTGLYDAPVSPEQFGVPGLAEEITQVAPMPSVDVMERIIQELQ